MRFEVADRSRVETRFPQSLRDHIRLRRRIGYAETIRASSMVDRRGFDDAVNEIAILFGLIQRLEHDRANPFAGHITIGLRAEAVAPTGGRKHAERAGIDEF